MSARKMSNNKGHNKEPCGTSPIIFRTELKYEFIFTLSFLLFKRIEIK